MVNQPSQVHLSFLPVTRGGRWAVGLAVVSLLALAFDVVVVVAGHAIFDNLLLVVWTLAAVAAAPASLVLALVAVLGNHERGLLVVFPILWGLAVGFLPVLVLAFPP